MLRSAQQATAERQARAHPITAKMVRYAQHAL
jgi:hypothetical protein